MEAGPASPLPEPHFPFQPGSSTSQAAGRSRLRRNERLTAWILWLYLLLLISGLVVGRSAGAALFLHVSGPRSLGAIYVLVALSVAALVYGTSRVAESVGHVRMALATILVAAAGNVCVCLYYSPAEAEAGGALCTALYVAIEAFTFVAPLQFWTLCNRLFDWKRAQRRYAFIASGGILGSVVGGAVPRLMHLNDPLNLLWAVSALCISAGGVLLLLGSLDRGRAFVEDGTPRPRDARDAPHGARPSAGLCHAGARSDAPDAPWRRLSVQLGLVAFITVATTTLADFVFKFRAAQQYSGDAAALSRFFGDYYLALGVTTLTLQLVVTRRLLRHGGVFAGLMLMPLALGAAMVLNLFSPTLLAAVVLKLVDSGIGHSVGRSCREMLLTAVPTRLVGGFQALTDGVCGRLGLLCCGAVLLVVGPYVRPVHVLAAMGLFVMLWVGALETLRRTYESHFPETAPKRRRRLRVARHAAEPVALGAALDR